MKDTTIRIDKYLSGYGVCSRRDVAEFLRKNNVLVNGMRASEHGQRINPLTDVIKINGKSLEKQTLVYYLLNKPKSFISTSDDEFGRKNVTSLIPEKRRIFPVGRLDKDTTGLLILTNDGELTNFLTHPRYHINKTYRLTIKGNIKENQLKKMRNGVVLKEAVTAKAEVNVITVQNDRSILEMTIYEGRNRQIRRMCEAVGVTLLELERTKIGPLTTGDLKVGEYRKLTKKEVNELLILTKNT